MQADELARLTITHLTGAPTDFQKAIARQDDETEAAYIARMEALADGSAGAVRLIIFNRVAQRTNPDELDKPTDLTPISSYVVPVIIA